MTDFLIRFANGHTAVVEAYDEEDLAQYVDEHYGDMSFPAIYIPFDDPHTRKASAYAPPGHDIHKLGESCDPDDAWSRLAETYAHDEIEELEVDRQRLITELAFPNLAKAYDTITRLLHVTHSPTQQEAEEIRRIESKMMETRNLSELFEALDPVDPNNPMPLPCVMTQEVLNLRTALIRKDLEQVPSGWKRLPLFEKGDCCDASSPSTSRSSGAAHLMI